MIKPHFVFVFSIDCNFSSGECLPIISKIISGETYSKCSVLAAGGTRGGKGLSNKQFNVHLQLRGWKQNVVMEVIEKHFNYSPNKVLALKLKLTSNDPFKHLLKCPLLTQLGNTFKLFTKSSSTLNTYFYSLSCL